VNNCYVIYRYRPQHRDPEGSIVILLLAGIVLFASFLGALSYVTAPVALALTAVISGWLLLFGVRTLLARKEARRG
jgi:hypothetical protein